MQAGIDLTNILDNLYVVGVSLLVFFLLDSLNGGLDTLYISLGLGAVLLLSVFANQFALHLAYRCGLRLRTLFIGLIYQQLLDLRLADVPDANSVTNLIANDAQKFIEISEGKQ